MDSKIEEAVLQLGAYSIIAVIRTVVLAAAAGLVEVCWNHAMVKALVFASTIDFWQAGGLVVLVLVAGRLFTFTLTNSQKGGAP